MQLSYPPSRMTRCAAPALLRLQSLLAPLAMAQAAHRNGGLQLASQHGSKALAPLVLKTLNLCGQAPKAHGFRLPARFLACSNEGLLQALLQVRALAQASGLDYAKQADPLLELEGVQQLREEAAAPIHSLLQSM